MEAKIEYQLPAWQAEDLAVEQATMQLAANRMNQWVWPVAWGVLFAILFAGGCESVNGTHTTVILPIGKDDIAPAFAFCLGFGFSRRRQYIGRNKSLARVRNDARLFHQKFGDARTISWDTEAIVFSSAVSQAQIKWRVIDELKCGESGIYGLVAKKYVFAFPKAALPPGLTAEDLIKTWQSYCAKPPKVA